MWLPNWPILRLQRHAVRSDRPLATLETVRGQRRLAALCPRAQDAGLHPAMPLAQARAICPELDVTDADPAADRAALTRLAAWCERYTPLAAPDPPDGLWLDIAGCGHLFGSEDALAADLAARLDRSGLPHRMALAGATGAAWALARATTGPVLAPLPVALLRLEPSSVVALRRVGLRTIGELTRQSRASLAARFGKATLLRLDHATGAVEEPIAWPRPPAPWSERLAFAEPIATPEDLARALDTLAHALCARLEAAEQGALRVTAAFLRLDGARPHIATATALPRRDPGAMTKLLCEKLDTIDPGFGVDAMVLEAEDTAPLRAPQRSLDDCTEAAPLATTIDALANRGDVLWRDAPFASHLPERAVRPAPPLAVSAWETTPERPIRLFPNPELIAVTALVPDEPPIMFRWRGALHRVRAASGPERIAAEWWRRDVLRDYYRVEDMAGARFWIFRVGLEGVPEWYLHGLFA